MVLKILVGKTVVNVSAYAPQAGLPEEQKDFFFKDLFNNIMACKDDELVFVGGNLNGHVGKDLSGFEGYHGGFGYGERNAEGT